MSRLYRAPLLRCQHRHLLQARRLSQLSPTVRHHRLRRVRVVLGRLHHRLLQRVVRVARRCRLVGLLCLVDLLVVSSLGRGASRRVVLVRVVIE